MTGEFGEKTKITLASYSAYIKGLREPGRAMCVEAWQAGWPNLR